MWQTERALGSKQAAVQRNTASRYMYHKHGPRVKQASPPLAYLLHCYSFMPSIRLTAPDITALSSSLLALGLKVDVPLHFFIVFFMYTQYSKVK